MKRNVLLIAIIVFLFAALVKVQQLLTSYSDVQWKQESFSYLPDNKRIGDFLLGYKTTVSHFLWIKTVIYFGGHYVSDKQYTWIVNMIDIITKLNPNFYPAYEFAGVLLPDLIKNPDVARIILERGVARCPVKSWQLAFYMGLLYYKYYKDTFSAAQYIELASRAPDAPKEKLVGLAAHFYRKSGMEDYGLSYLKLMYETCDNPEVKRHILEKIDKFLHDSNIK